MTTHAHRTPFRPFDRDLRRQRPERAQAGPLDHGDRSTGVELFLAALLVVIAGPLAEAFAPASTWVAAGSTALLVVGLALAAAAAWHLLHERG